MVLPPSAVVEVRLATGQQATLSVDGERDLDLVGRGDTVRVALGSHRARFLRLSPPAQFYERLARRLNWLRGGEPGSPDPSIPPGPGEGALR